MASSGARVREDAETERFLHCPVCGAERTLSKARRLASNADIDGWLCPGSCERKWWGASDLIAVLQAADRHHQQAPPKRFGAPLLWEERESAGSSNILKFREDDQPWYVNWNPRNIRTQLRDAYLLKLDFAGLRRFIRTLDALRNRPHRMLGGRPKYPNGSSSE